MIIRKIAAIMALGIFLSGCAGTAYIRPPIKLPAGTYHRVRKGETLWCISKYYGVDMERIASANRLPDKGKIYEGQQLFIPGGAGSPHGEAAGRFVLPNLASIDEKGFIWPVKGKVISFYGSIEDNVKNKGIDINVKKGDNVVASRSGTVSYCDESMKGFGKTVIIDHGDGFSTVYAHNSEIIVKTGERVDKKTVIAKAGESGRASSPRLHFEIRKHKIPQNPFYYLP